MYNIENEMYVKCIKWNMAFSKRRPLAQKSVDMRYVAMRYDMRYVPECLKILQLHRCITYALYFTYDATHLSNMCMSCDFCSCNDATCTETLLLTAASGDLSKKAGIPQRQRPIKKKNVH